MTDLNTLFKRHWLSVAFILVSGGGAFAAWYFHLPTWTVVLCLTFLGFAIIGFLGDLGLFGGAEDD